MGRGFWRALTAAGVVLAAASVTGEECLDLVGGWWHGPPRAVAADNTRLYYGTANSLVVMDVSDPLAPQEMGSIAVEDIRSITVSDDLAYVLTWFPRLHIIDVSTPSAPREVGRLENRQSFGSFFSRR